MFEYSDIGSMALGLTEGVAVVDHDDVGKSEPWDGDYRDHHIVRLAIRLQAHKLW